MSSRKKSYYKSLILTIIGFALCIAGLILTFIIGTALKNSILSIVGMFLMFIGLFTIISDDNLRFMINRRLTSRSQLTLFKKYVLYGTPNNKLAEFDVSADDIFSCQTIEAYEQEDGKFKMTVGDKELVFDLNEWHNKCYCLYEYFMSIIQISLANNKHKAMRKSIHVDKMSDLSLNISLKNGKTKGYILIQNSQTKPTKKFKHRMSIKQACLEQKTIYLKDLYDFNE